MQSEQEQMGYLSQLEEVEECESTENELQAENDVGKHMEVTMIKNRNEIKILNYHYQEETEDDNTSMSNLVSSLKLQLKEVCILCILHSIAHPCFIPLG